MPASAVPKQSYPHTAIWSTRNIRVGMEGPGAPGALILIDVSVDVVGSVDFYAPIDPAAKGAEMISSLLESEKIRQVRDLIDRVGCSPNGWYADNIAYYVVLVHKYVGGPKFPSNSSATVLWEKVAKWFFPSGSPDST